MTPERRAAVIEWERWRLRFHLSLVDRAQTVETATWEQSVADMALKALVRLGCNEAEELREAAR